MFLPYDSFSPGESAYFKRMEQEHEDFTERLRKTLYYGDLPGTDRPSLPLTDLAVRYYQEAAPRELGKLDHYWAASTSRAACMTPSSVVAGMIAACMTPSSVVAGMMYVKRLKKRKAEYLSQISSSDLFLISVMMASKFLYDEGIDEEVFNDEWATSGNLDTENVNELEREFLSAIDWQLFVKPDEFQEMLKRIEKRLALEQGLDRGWFSYTDLELLTRDLSFINMCDQQLKEFTKVLGISTLAYVAGILTMVGSTIMASTASSALVHFGSTTLPQMSRLLPTTLTPAALHGLMFQSYTITPGSESGSTIPDELLDTVNMGQMVDRLQIQAYCNQTFDGSSAEGPVENAKDSEKLDEDDIEKASHEDEAKDVNNARVQNKDGSQFISSFLSPFLALVTLKDTITKFSQTLMEQEPDKIDEMESTADEICSDGPCLPDSWKNCWNFSSEHDWSAFKAGQARESTRNGYVSQHRNIQGKTGNQLNGRTNNNNRAGNNERTDYQKLDLYSTICCCKDIYKGMSVKLGMNDRYMGDFRTGFTTTTYPILVT